VQEKAWPEISRGAHVLVAAPTGTGKTLAAFLWGLDQLARGSWAPGKVRILYVSPLKALNNDIQKNLLEPLAGLDRVFREAGRSLPQIRVLTRSGDTPSSERQRMLRRPPEILITTPESLNLLLSTANGRAVLDGLSTVILDEIHAVVSTKRGTHLITAVERLSLLSGEFQRIALSATVRPLSTVAEFIGGHVLERTGGAPSYRRRAVQIVNCPLAKKYEVSVRFVGTGQAVQQPNPEDTIWAALAMECRAIARENRSTLFFVNSRRHAEKLCRLINEGQAEQMAWSHHGSLSRELRLVVEQRLKRGELRALVATSSLELGIDIGALDQVILVQTPFSVSSAVQRMGRAGHRVGAPSRAVIFPLFGRDIADAAVMAAAVRERDIEDAAPVLCPLDVLAQIMVSMTSVETWKVEELFDAVRVSHPFHDLSRGHFDLVLAMLCGKYEGTRLRDLSPLLSSDAIEGTVRARTGATLRLYTSGGTIPDRGYFTLRTADTRALIGELDEEFVWERSVGDSFFLGTQAWRIQKMDHQNVEVVPVRTPSAMAPFWRAEERNRDFHLSERISLALEAWSAALDAPGLEGVLREDGLEPDAASALVAFLTDQRKAAAAELPHRHHLLVEHTRDVAGAAAPGAAAEGSTTGPGRACRVVLHTLWGGKVNRPYGLALAAAWEERFGYPPELIQDNDSLLLILPEDVPAAEILSLVTPENVERLLRTRLEASGFFGARFRENAARALLLPKPASNKRVPLWFTRLRAKRLLAAVSRFDDFPIIAETWRACLRDEFDMPNLLRVLGELADGTIRVSEARTAVPSPFCGGLVWKQTNTYMYADDTPRGAAGASLRGDLIRELALSPDLRPRIPAALAAELTAKLSRTFPGYAPRGARELLDWVKERLLVPLPEWEELLAACERDHGTPREELLSALEGKLSTVSLPGGAAATAAREAVSGIMAGAGAEGGAAELMAQWLRFTGPVAPDRLRVLFGLDQERLDGGLGDLVEQELVIVDRLLDGTDEVLVCDRENLEALLRMARTRARPSFEALPVDALPLYVASRQGLTQQGGGAERLKEVLERLFGFALPARLWEAEVLPARLEGYRGAWLDGLFAQGGLMWLGCGRQRISFCFREDAALFAGAPAGAAGEGAVPRVFPTAAGKFGFWDLADHTGLGSAELSETLWRLAWAGAASNDSFQSVRRGIAGGFRAAEAGERGRVRRTSFDRWQSSRPAGGFWFPVPRQAERDALEEEEVNRDRIRQVLQRWGVVFRELLENELPGLRWGALFRSLRIMELSGEVLAGRFFLGVSGLQFALPQAVEELTRPLDEDAVFWMCAADPASLCGTGLEGLRGTLPARFPTTHVVFHGRAVVLVSRRHGRELDFRLPPEDPLIPACLGFMKVLVQRDAAPLPVVRVEKINGERAVSSPYRPCLLAFGFTEDFRRLEYRAAS
jgi:ATP-dependent helicase Lhr and Lhr-like helicase